MRQRAIAALFFAVFAVSVEDARAASWLPGVDLASRVAGPSTVEVTSRGETIVVWTLESDGKHRIEASIRPPGGSFGPVTEVVQSDGIVENLELAIDPAGNAILTWRGVVSVSDIRLYFSERPSGGAFTPPQEVSSAGAHIAQPKTAMDAAGNAITVFRRAPGGDEHISAVYKPAGGNYGAQDEITTVKASNPALAVAPDGSALAAWTTEPAGVLQAARRAPGGEFGSIQTLTPGSAKSLDSVMSPGGRAALAWSRFDGSDSVIEAAIAEPGGPYGAPTPLSSPGFNSEIATAAIDAAGGAAVTWRDGGPGNTLRAAAAPPGGPFAPTTPPGLSGYPGDGEFLPDGSLFQALSPEGPEPYAALLTVRSPAGQFSPLATLSQAGENTRWRDLDADQAGNLVALYGRREDPFHSTLRVLGYDGVPPAFRSLSVPAKPRTGKAASFSADVFDLFGAATEWRFGDGQRAAGATVEHTFRDTGGRRTVTVTATDPAGQATTETRVVEVKDVTPVALTRVRFRPASFAPKGGGAGAAKVRKGSRLRYRLSEPARVRIRLERRRSQGGRTRYVALKKKPLVKRGKRGGNGVRFSGRGLAPGRYQAALLATDTGGLKSKTKYAPFRIVRP
jgi:hypothetical protein